MKPDIRPDTVYQKRPDIRYNFNIVLAVAASTLPSTTSYTSNNAGNGLKFYILRGIYYAKCYGCGGGGGEKGVI